MPRGQRISFFLDDEMDLASRVTLIQRKIDLFLEQTKRNSISADTQDALVQICKSLAKKYTRRAYPSTLIAHLQVAAAKLGDQSLLAALTDNGPAPKNSRDSYYEKLEELTGIQFRDNMASFPPPNKRGLPRDDEANPGPDNEPSSKRLRG